MQPQPLRDPVAHGCHPRAKGQPPPDCCRGSNTGRAAQSKPQPCDKRPRAAAMIKPGKRRPRCRQSPVPCRGLSSSPLTLANAVGERG